MKINLIGDSFDKDLGQGIYRYSGELYDNLLELKCNVVINEKNGDINHLQQPELIWKNLFKKNLIITFHDIMPFFIKERKRLFNLYFKLSCFVASKRAKKIIAVSNCTKKDIIKYLKIKKEKISVIYEGISFNPKNLKKKKKSKIVIGYLGGLGKRKNVSFILRIAKKFPQINFLIGGTGGESDSLIKLKEELNLKNIKFLGLIHYNDLILFYNSLDFFIFPSLYEGFGLPVVEAMKCGVIPLVSDRGSLPEIVPNKDYIIDIDHIDKTCKQINNLLKDKNSINKMRKESLNKSKEFQWIKTAKETLKLYEEMHKNG